jgi:deoxyribose-phosphate aldolase
MALAGNAAYEAVASMFDHALLRQDMTVDEVRAGCEQARAYEIASVCVRPCDVPLAASVLAGAPRTVVCTVIGFPHGTTSTAAKVAESREALTGGAKELDMVLNIGWLKSGKVDDVRADIAAVVAAGHAGGALVKVIFETSLLTDAEKTAACEAASAAGADFVKTSTGFAGGGSTPHDLRLMRAAAPAGVRVKASGGVKTLAAVFEARGCGASRIGTSASFAMLEELKGRIAAGASAGVPPIATRDDVMAGAAPAAGGSGSAMGGGY